MSAPGVAVQGAMLKTPRPLLLVSRSSVGRPRTISTFCQRRIPPVPTAFGIEHNYSLGESRRPWTAGKAPIPSVRRYATGGGPSQSQVFENFGTPFLAFFGVLGRISRVVLITGGSIIAIGAIAFEGTHLYVEHVGMPRSQVRASFLEHGNVQGENAGDEWGWAQEMSDESWSGKNSKGTDSRLGWRARHLVRAAWICANWGGGLLPESILSPSSHAHIMGMPGRSSKLHMDEGLESAAGYLDAALLLAEERGIRLPDMAAIRAGISSPTDSNIRASDNALDETALALEMKLASLQERQGTDASLRRAVAGYTRIYDALANLDATNRAMKSVGRSSGQPQVRPDRLVRLATRVGNLHLTIGNIEQAESWLLRAVGTAGEGAPLQMSQDDPSRKGIYRNEILYGSDADEGKALRASQPLEMEEALTATNADTTKDSTAGQGFSSPADAPPSPVLTRSLISALLALSALNAQPEEKSRLEKALQFQASALRLTRIEMGRLVLSDQVAKAVKNSEEGKSPSAAPLPAQLHSLWLAQHDGLASVHIAETMYALGGNKAASASSAVRSMLSAIGLGGRSVGKAQQALPISSSSATDQTLAWLDEAQTRATAVSMQMGQTKSRRPGEAVDLLDKWQKLPLSLAVPAQRLLRDSLRLREAATEMQAILASKGNGKN